MQKEKCLNLSNFYHSVTKKRSRPEILPGKIENVFSPEGLALALDDLGGPRTETKLTKRSVSLKRVITAALIDTAEPSLCVERASTGAASASAPHGRPLLRIIIYSSHKVSKLFLLAILGIRSTSEQASSKIYKVLYNLCNENEGIIYGRLYSSM